MNAWPSRLVRETLVLGDGFFWTGDRAHQGWEFLRTWGVPYTTNSEGIQNQTVVILVEKPFVVITKKNRGCRE